MIPDVSYPYKRENLRSEANVSSMKINLRHKETFHDKEWFFLFYLKGSMAMFYVEMLWKLYFEGSSKCIVTSTFPGWVGYIGEGLYWLFFWKPTILLYKIIILPANGTLHSTEILHARPQWYDEIHRSEPCRPHLKQIPAPQVILTYMTNKSFISSLFLFLFF